MKREMNVYFFLIKRFIRKNYLFFVAFKIVKLAVFLLFISSCSSPEGGSEKPETIKPDTVKIDTIPNNSPEDSVIFKNEEDEELKEKEEIENNSVIQQEV